MSDLLWVKVFAEAVEDAELAKQYEKFLNYIYRDFGRQAVKLDELNRAIKSPIDEYLTTTEEAEIMTRLEFEKLLERMTVCMNTPIGSQNEQT